MTPTGAPLTLRTLGDCLLGGGEGGSSFGRGKPYAVVGYLACVPGRTATRDELVSLLWSSVGAEEGRHALRHTMWSLRKRLGDAVIAGEGTTVRLGSPIESDRDRFMAAVEGARLAEAVELYAGEYLAGLALPGGGEFERWADLERGRLRALFLRAADAHARALLGAGKFREAQQVARRAVDAAPYNQSARRLVLDVLIAANDPLTAAAEADTIDRYFTSEEIDLEPSTAATIAAARTPRATGADADQRGGFSTDLVGREREFSLLIDRWRDARAGRFSHVHVSGAAGLGKSRLLDDFAARLRSRRSRLAFVRGKSGERHLPFALAADLAESLARMPGAAGIAGDAAGSLVAMNPSLSTTFPGSVPDGAGNGDAIRRRAIALADLARAVADDAPLAILIDDLHWADAESKQVVSAFLSRLDGVRGMAVTTARPSEDVVLQRDPDDSVRLEPLQATAIYDLLASIGTLPDEDWAATLPSQLRQATGGLPLHVIETLKLALDRGALILSNGAWLCTDRVALRELLVEGSGLERRLRGLTAEEMELLTLLSLAGIPFTATGVAGALGSGAAAVEERLVRLEQRGMVRRTGDAWRVAHDEIADAAIAITSGAAMREAHRRIGVHFAAIDSQHRGLAVQHLLAAGERGAIADLFRHEVSAARRRGDWRSTPIVAREFVGGTASEAVVEELVGAIPLGLRRRWRVGLFAAAASLALAAVSGVAWALFRSPEPDSWVEVVERVGADLRVTRAGISDATFRTGTAITYSAPEIISGLDSTSDAVYSARFRLRLPDGRWVYYRTTRDAGGTDIFIRSPNGSEERITDSPGDDVVATLSPDNRYLLFTTERWNPREHSDLAIYDFATRTTRALTKTDATEASPQWSPGGAFIAFEREFHDERPPEICVIGFDGTDERCATAPGGLPTIPLGWRTPSEVIVQAFGDTGSTVLTLDPERWSYQPIHDGAQAYFVSRSGAFFAAKSLADSGGVQWIIGSTRTRGVARDLPHVPALAVIRFADGARGTPYLAGISIVGATQRADLARSIQLRVDGRDQFGDAFPAGHVVWSSLTPQIASVSEAGTLVPATAGVARIVASAHGWRADTVTIEVTGMRREGPTAPVPPPYSLVQATDWRSIDQAEWRPYGTPRPSVTLTDSGATLSTNGDSTFSSGVYSVRGFPARSGVGARTIVSVDLNWIQWQIADLELFVADREALRQWDHFTAALPMSPNGQACAISLPNGEGTLGATKGNLVGGGAQRSFPLSAAQRKGAWIRFDVQVFPDGRCGFAVDGRPVWISTKSFASDDSVTVSLSGKAYHTHSWFGKTEIWSGVRTDINWAPLLNRSR